MSGITVEDMRDQLLTIDQVREVLTPTDSLSTVEVPSGDDISFSMSKGALSDLSGLAGTDLVEAYATIKGKEYQLSKDALLEATSAIGLPEAYVRRSPEALINPQLAYWYKRGLEGAKKEQKALVLGDTIAGFTKATVEPFSNLRLLDTALAGIEKKYGKGEVLADYKLQHSLRSTNVRLIVPGMTQEIADTGRDDDQWSAGVQIKNSLIGASQTEIDAYLFAWWCTNGAITTRGEESAVWHRRGKSGNDTKEVYEWAARSVDDILGGLEHQLDNVQQLARTPLEGDHAVTAVFAALWEEFSIPAADRLAIMNHYADEPGGDTMYRVMNSITQHANRPDMDPAHVNRLLQAGGTLPTAHHARCNSCNRVSL